jgi:C4-dicarboxylate-specific signal transduction histidine kinase
VAFQKSRVISQSEINAKEQIKELNATLEQRVIERTNQLQESEKKISQSF